MKDLRTVPWLLDDEEPGCILADTGSDGRPTILTVDANRDLPDGTATQLADHIARLHNATLVDRYPDPSPAPQLTELLGTVNGALTSIGAEAVKARDAKRTVGSPGDYGYSSPAGKAIATLMKALSNLIFEVETNAVTVEETLPRILQAQIDAHKAETAAIYTQIRDAIDAPRYPGTPTTTDEAPTDSEKELVSILDHIGGIACGALASINDAQDRKPCGNAATAA